MTKRDIRNLDTLIMSLNNEYKFEIHMDDDGLFHCYVWGEGRIIHSKHRLRDESEAEAWIEKRAAFLNKTKYTITKKLVY